MGGGGSVRRGGCACVYVFNMYVYSAIHPSMSLTTVHALASALSLNETIALLCKYIHTTVCTYTRFTGNIVTDQQIVLAVVHCIVLEVVHCKIFYSEKVHCKRTVTLVA